MHGHIPEPWLSFLVEADATMDQMVTIHCLGGFSLIALWGLPRPTGDVDFIEVSPIEAVDALLRVAGEGSALAKKYGLHFQQVTIAEYPEGYASRLIDITPSQLEKIRLLSLEVHDLVLAKLSRNSPRDRSDVAFLVNKDALDRKILENRFRDELRPYLLNEKRESLTFRLWIEEFFDIP
jgi:hypothetical protein